MKPLVLVIALLLSFVITKAQKVYSVDYENQADIKVYVVLYENQADLLVYKVKYDENQAGWRNNSKMYLMY